MQVCTSLQADIHASTLPPSFLQAGCPSCRPTNSVKALKASLTTEALNFLIMRSLIMHGRVGSSLSGVWVEWWSWVEQHDVIAASCQRYSSSPTTQTTSVCTRFTHATFHYVTYVICWWRSTVVERLSLTGELSLSCARPAADGWPLMWVSHPLQVSQLGQLSLSSCLGR